MNKQISLLVVDDEPNGFDVIEAHLYREGYDLTYASSGIEALNNIDSIEPDVILLDVMMPQLDGVEVCRRLKSDPHWKHIPIIMVTALNSKEDLARSLDAGADDFLTKPVSGIELRARVRSMLRIKQQYDALQATLHLREDLSNMIVHDLRNPLTTILMTSSLLMDSTLEEKNFERLKLLVSAGRQLDSMIDDLLIVAKMQSGKLMLNLAEVDLNDLATKSLSQFSGIAASKHLQLNSQLPETSYTVSGDANLLHRVIDNLLSNAIKFSPPNRTVTLQVDYPNVPVASGSISVKHDTKRSQAQQESYSGERASAGCSNVQAEHGSIHPAPKQATIRIADQGAGIREDLRQRIFEKYEVGDAFNGISQLGLGLAFCKMVVEAHRGTIFVEDNKPYGSIFTVVL